MQIYTQRVIAVKIMEKALKEEDVDAQLFYMTDVALR